MSTATVNINTDEMEFDPNAIDTIDQETVETTGPMHPTVQWHYGDTKMKKAGGMDYMGGWFIPEDVVDGDVLQAAGWEPASWSRSDGAETPGFWRREIAVAIINTRKRWEVISEGGPRRMFAWNQYAAAEAAAAQHAVRPKSRLHVLCLVKGLEDLGPMVLTLKGTGGMYFEGTRQVKGALTEFAATVIKAANAQTKGGKRWPYRAFWLPVGADRDAKGQPVFTEVGKGNTKQHLVMPVALGLPAKAEAVMLKRFYVGNDLLRTVNELYTDAEAGWTHAWDNIESGASEDGSAPAATEKAEEPVSDAALEALGL